MQSTTANSSTATADNSGNIYFLVAAHATGPLEGWASVLCRVFSASFQGGFLRLLVEAIENGDVGTPDRWHAHLDHILMKPGEGYSLG